MANTIILFDIETAGLRPLPPATNTVYSFDLKTAEEITKAGKKAMKKMKNQLSLGFDWESISKRNKK